MSWHEQNREYLALAIEELQARIDPGASESPAAELEALAAGMSAAPALEMLAESLELDEFERDVVLLCVAGDVDPGLQPDQHPVTVGYALGVVPGAHWHALDAASPLRRWGIVEVDARPSLVTAPIRVPEDVLRYLLGFDPRDGGAPIFAVPAERRLVLPSQARAAGELARAITLTAEATGAAPVVEVHGPVEEDRLALAELAARDLGATVAAAGARHLPPAGAELVELLQSWNRWSVMTGTWLLIAGGDEDDPAVRDRLAQALVHVRHPLFVSVRSPTTSDPTRPVIRWEAAELTAGERAEAWEACTDASRSRLGIRQRKPVREAVASLATEFRLGTRTIERVCLEAESLHSADAEASDAAAGLASRLRRGCARAVRAQMDPLAERLPLRDVPDVALPDRERRELDELERQIRLRHLVDVEWGFARGRDSGVTALFAGPSGTGKTHAAMALARRIGLDLYRVNVAGVLSKYIGETEQNLDRIFEAARPGGVLLLFDEADALFGKRSEVKDAHDRYANLGTAYLLQRIETAPTPTILTTNLKEGLDPAFTRRLHFVIDFPFPREAERARIWETIYPAGVPTRGLAPERLSQLAVTGGAIWSIARRGAFLADGGVVEMRHLLEGAFSELRKSDREPSPEETAGWV